MLYISYATKDEYEKVLNTYLYPSLKKYNLPNLVRLILPFKSWKEATNYKSKFILEVLLQEKRDIVFVDADAEILEYPKLFDVLSPAYDMALHWLDWKIQYNKDRSEKELLSGTLMIRYNTKTIYVLNQWIEEIEKNPVLWEQKHLERIVKKGTTLNIFNLPIAYCCIKRKDETYPCERPVILHNQVSRYLKRRQK